MPVDVARILSQGQVYDASGKPVTDLFQVDKPDTGSLADEKIVALYFSAHWCPPCRGFTPQLAQCYENVRRQGRDFEVVFCSWDEQRREYEQYASTMPWARLPFKDPRVDQLRTAFGIYSIPSLVLINARDGSVVSTGARSSIPYDLAGREYPWPSKPWGMFHYGCMAAAGALTTYLFVWPRFMK